MFLPVTWRVLRWIIRVCAYVAGTTPLCLTHGHAVREVRSNRLLHQKGNRPMVDVYSGVYWYCTRPRCAWHDSVLEKTGSITIAEMRAWLKEQGEYNATRLAS